MIEKAENKIDLNLFLIKYWSKYGNTLVEHHNLPDFVRDIRPPPGLLLACDIRPDHYIPTLEGDVHLLSQLDLHREGLSEYSNFIRSSGSGGHRHDNFYERSTSSPPRGNIIRTLIDSTRPDNYQPAGTAATSIYRSTTITDTTSHGPGYSSML